MEGFAKDRINVFNKMREKAMRKRDSQQIMVDIHLDDASDSLKGAGAQRKDEKMRKKIPPPLQLLKLLLQL